MLHKFSVLPASLNLKFCSLHDLYPNDFDCGTADESCNPTPLVSSVPWQQLEWLLCNNLFWTGVFLVPLSCRIFVVVEFSDIAKKINFYFRHFWFPLFLFIFLYNVRSIVVENTWVSTHFTFINLCFQFFSNLKKSNQSTYAHWPLFSTNSTTSKILSFQFCSHRKYVVQLFPDSRTIFPQGCLIKSTERTCQLCLHCFRSHRSLDDGLDLILKEHSFHAPV